MISDQDIRTVAAERGVPERQIRRDHLLSHLLLGIREVPDVVFIGGTALNRTHLPDSRLSEDIDLHGMRSSDDVLGAMLEGVRLEFPDLGVDRQTRHGDVTTTMLVSGDLRLQVQVIGRRHEWAQLPTPPTPVRLRYPDLPESVDLLVPTPGAFVAMKLSSFLDRGVPRDLFDLARLAEAGHMDTASLDLVEVVLGRVPVPAEFEALPTDDQWDTELAHQVRNPGSPGTAMSVVRAALAELLDW